MLLKITCSIIIYNLISKIKSLIWAYDRDGLLLLACYQYPNLNLLLSIEPFKIVFFSIYNDRNKRFNY